MDAKTYVQKVVPIMKAGRPRDSLRAAVFDIEVYRNYFLAGFRSLDTGLVRTFEIRGSDFESREVMSLEDRQVLERILLKNMTIGFNSRNYDLPLTMMAVRGHSIHEIKQASDWIILNGAKPWDVERQHNFKIPMVNHIDLIEVAPGQASLKIYGGRLHAKRMQDLPYDPDAVLHEHEIEILKRYWVNDLDTTEGLFEHLLPQIELRARMSEEYDQDLRSKSDAQIAEAVIKSQLEKLTGDVPKRPSIAGGTAYRYRMPDFIDFTSPELVALKADVEAAVFRISDSGKMLMPKALEDAKIRIGNGTYRLGIGGLHSSETTAAHVSDEDFQLIDRDVASYYPAIILNQGLMPKHMGPPFLRVYRGIVDRRLGAKRAGDKVTADTLKITINGSFGKFGSKWSALYSPDLMIQTTVTGQLALLMLIEWLYGAGIEVVSANTDGIVVKVPTAAQIYDDFEFETVVRDWEKATGFETEATEYAALYSRDVNNYIAVKPGGEVKLKGAYASPGLQKNPTNEISVAAVIAFLTAGTPVSETILACRDVRQFVTVRQVRGGAVQADRYLGKAIRWIYSKASPGPILYKTNGNKVPRSDGSRALMDLPDAFPSDLDHAWYIAEAYRVLRDIGHRGAVDPTFDFIFQD